MMCPQLPRQGSGPGENRKKQVSVLRELPETSSIPSRVTSLPSQAVDTPRLGRSLEPSVSAARDRNCCRITAVTLLGGLAWNFK